MFISSIRLTHVLTCNVFMLYSHSCVSVTENGAAYKNRRHSSTEHLEHGSEVVGLLVRHFFDRTDAKVILTVNSLALWFVLRPSLNIASGNIGNA